MTMIIPASLKMATLFPCEAMRVRRPALPLRFVAKVVNVSVYQSIHIC